MRWTWENEVEPIISNRVLGSDDYRWYQRQRKERLKKKRRKDKRNFWVALIIMILLAAGLLYLEYHTR